MIHEEPWQVSLTSGSFVRLHLNFLEKLVIGSLLVTLFISCVDALDGQHVGKGNALQLAKLKGQQELVATRFKPQHLSGLGNE